MAMKRKDTPIVAKIFAGITVAYGKAEAADKTLLCICQFVKPYLTLRLNNDKITFQLDINRQWSLPLYADKLMTPTSGIFAHHL